MWTLFHQKISVSPQDDEQGADGGSKKKKLKKDGKVVKYLSHAKPYKVSNGSNHQSCKWTDR